MLILDMSLLVEGEIQRAVQ